MSYRRKYKVGDRINSLDELVKETNVYAFGTCARGIRHISVIESMTLRTVKCFLGRGIYKAIPVETAPIIEAGDGA